LAKPLSGAGLNSERKASSRQENGMVANESHKDNAILEYPRSPALY
jgi:hypothetical protein